MSMQECVDYNKLQAENSASSAVDSALSAVDSSNSAKNSSDSAVVASEAAITAIEAANGGDFSNSILKGAVGEICSPLLDLPLKNNLIPSKSANPATDVTFTRSTTATYVDRYGVLQTAQIDEPRFEKEGLLIEGESTNLFLNSDVGATQNITTVVGETYTLSFLSGDGSIEISLGGSGTATKGNNISFVATNILTTLTVVGTAEKVQFENLPFATSYIHTTTTATTRAADTCYVNTYNNATNTQKASTTMSVKFKPLGFFTDGLLRQILANNIMENAVILIVDKTLKHKFGLDSKIIKTIAEKENQNISVTYETAGASGVATGYINGVSYGSYSETTSSTRNATTITIGSGHYFSDSSTYGHFSGVKIYDKSLSPTAVALLG